MWRAPLCLALVLLLAKGSASSVGAQQPPALPELPQIAFESFPSTARSVIQKALEGVLTRPDDARANGELGMALHAHHAFEEAELCYRRAHILDPGSFRWLYYLGWVQAAQGDCAAAATTLQDALRLDPDYLPAQLKLGECLLGLGRWQQAASHYEAILQKHPESAAAHYGRGRLRAVRNDLYGAIEAFRKACDLYPRFGAARYGLAQTYKRIGKRDLSLGELALFERTKFSAPDSADRLLEEVRSLNANPSDQMHWGIANWQEGKLDAAVAAFGKAVEIDPNLVEAHIHLISLYGRLGQFAKSEEHFQAAVRIDRNRAAANFNYGTSLAAQGRFADAEGAFRKTLELDSNFPDARTRLAQMLEAQGQFAQANEEYRKALGSNPRDFHAHFGLGRISVNQQNYQEGIQHFLNSLGTADEDSQPAALYALGATYARSRDLKKALYYLRLAREKAAGRGQSILVENIDADLELLDSEGR